MKKSERKKRIDKRRLDGLKNLFKNKGNTNVSLNDIQHVE